MEELRNCPFCNSLFIYKGVSGLCPQCTDNTEPDFQTVRDYIHKHPGSNTLEISGATGVKKDLILRFIRDGRLSPNISR